MDNEAITKNDLRAILDQLGMPFTPLDYYPIGAYFETSDSTFDPNTVWGGTWVLETSGYVHVSGDASGTSSPSYPVSKANNNSGAGASDGGSSTVTLTAEQSGVPAHAHGWQAAMALFGIKANTKENLNPQFALVSQSRTSGGYFSDRMKDGYGTATANNATKNATSAHNNMQPYINVYRWHRTA